MLLGALAGGVGGRQDRLDIAVGETDGIEGAVSGQCLGFVWELVDEHRDDGNERRAQAVDAGDEWMDHCLSAVVQGEVLGRRMSRTRQVVQNPDNVKVEEEVVDGLWLE